MPASSRAPAARYHSHRAGCWGLMMNTLSVSVSESESRRGSSICSECLAAGAWAPWRLRQRTSFGVVGPTVGAQPQPGREGRLPGRESRTRPCFPWMPTRFWGLTFAGGLVSPSRCFLPTLPATAILSVFLVFVNLSVCFSGRPLTALHSRRHGHETPTRDRRRSRNTHRASSPKPSLAHLRTGTSIWLPPATRRPPLTTDTAAARRNFQLQNGRLREETGSPDSACRAADGRGRAS